MGKRKNKNTPIKVMFDTTDKHFYVLNDAQQVFACDNGITVGEIDNRLHSFFSELLTYGGSKGMFNLDLYEDRFEVKLSTFAGEIFRRSFPYRLAELYWDNVPRFFDTFI